MKEGVGEYCYNNEIITIFYFSAEIVFFLV